MYSASVSKFYFQILFLLERYSTVYGRYKQPKEPDLLLPKEDTKPSREPGNTSDKEK